VFHLHESHLEMLMTHVSFGYRVVTRFSKRSGWRWRPATELFRCSLCGMCRAGKSKRMRATAAFRGKVGGHLSERAMGLSSRRLQLRRKRLELLYS
jgi:hypothetical protein